MPPELEGAVAIVTGAGRGIGRATALRLAAEGAHVVAADRRSAIAETAEEIGRLGHSGDAREVDVTNAAAVEELVETTARAHGRLDILVNNAGIVGRPAPLAELDEETFDRIFAVNVKGVFLGMRYALPLMISRRAGVVVNVASVTAVRNVPNLGAYAASKHAVVALTRAAATEAGPHGVRVNALLPGATNTPMVTGPPGSADTGAAEAFARQVPLGRISEPDEQAEVALFLVSPRSGYINGEAILVDGGMAYAQ